MDINDLENKVQEMKTDQNKIKEDHENLKDSVNIIQIGIAEIKIMLKERLEQENLKNDLLSKDIKNHEQRIKKIEDNTQWLWRTLVSSILTIVIGAIVFVVKMMN
jgi:hypothetical protein